MMTKKTAKSSRKRSAQMHQLKRGNQNMGTTAWVHDILRAVRNAHARKSTDGDN